MKKTGLYTRIQAALLSLFFVISTLQVQAANEVLSYLSVEYGDDSNTVEIHFHTPLKVTSHLMNAQQNVITLQLRSMNPRDQRANAGREEKLGWEASRSVPLDRVIYRGEAVGDSTLLVSLASPLQSYRLVESRDFFSIKLVLPATPDVNKVTIEPSQKTSVDEGAQAKDTDDSDAGQALSGRYAINLFSQNKPINLSKIPPLPAEMGGQLYLLKRKVDGVFWYRLRVGLYATAQDAIKVFKLVKHQYPRAWIDEVKQQEVRQLVKGGMLEPDSEGVMVVEKRSPVNEQIQAMSGRMLEKSKEVLTAGDYPKAIRLLTAVTENQNSPEAQEALELLGLARERNGQFNHAAAEYERYLALYPDSKGAARVKQRLAGVASAAEQPKEKLRTVKEEAPKSAWEVWATLAQSYRRDVINSRFSDSEETEVSRSDIDTDFTVNALKSTHKYDIRAELDIAHNHNLLNDGKGDESAISDAYIDIETNEEKGWYSRVGRQRQNSKGILGRFDGAAVGYQLNPDVKVGVVAGAPVDNSDDLYVRTDKHFWGANAELTDLWKDTGVNLFLIDQRVDGLVDRQAVGGEVRYFDEKRSVFSALDYDVYFGRLSSWLNQANFNLSEKTQAYVGLDYRHSPFLSTTSALQGQTAQTIDELKNNYSDAEIKQLAADRSASLTSLSVGGNHRMNPDLQLTGDITTSHIDSTPASGGVAATPSSGNEPHYTLQAIKNSLVKSGDVGIFTLRYSDSKTADTYFAGVNSRYPVNSLWRVSPRLSLAYRDDKQSADDRTTVASMLQAEYRFRNNIIFDFEVGVNWYQENQGGENIDIYDYLMAASYRWGILK